MMARSYSSLAEKYRAHRRAVKLGMRLGVTPAEAQAAIDRSEARKRWKEAKARLQAKIDGTPRESATRSFEQWDAPHMLRD
jgi:hypothetical protein